MNKKAKLIESSISKMKKIIESKIGEQQTNQNQTQQASQDPNRDAKIARNIDATMDQAMSQFVSNLPDMISNFVNTAGDKDGVLDAEGVYDSEQAVQQQQQQQQTTQQVNESSVLELKFDESKFLECMDEGELNEAGIMGLVASAPAILKYGGKASQWVGKKMNSQWLQKWGNRAAKAGENLHHKYIHAIEKVIAPFMPNASKEQIHQAANGIFMGGVAVLFAGGLAHPDALLGVKGAELGEFGAEVFKKAMPQLGFA